MTLEELGSKLQEPDDARRLTQAELEALTRRQEEIWQLERDKKALLDAYVSLMPDALDELDAAERQRVYNMLRVEAQVAPDGSLEVSGDVISVCEMELLSL
jgi:hypothetical protein